MRRRMRVAGMALPLALVAVAIVTLLLGGVLLLSVSHLNLSHVNSCYANAMKLAEAGVNWELNQVSRDPALANTTPITVALPTGSNRSFTVHIEPYPSGGAWVPGQPFWVISTGTVDGVSRTVRVVASGTGPSGFYALFGINYLDVGGNATVVGAVGSNGTVAVGGSTLFDGNFWYCGPAAGGSEANVEQATTGEVCHSPVSESFWTVDEIANLRSGTGLGLTYYQTNNANASIVNINGEPVTISNYRLDKTVFNKQPDGTIILGPGDYYFEQLSITANDHVIVDNSAGAVNIWIGPGPPGAKQVTISANSLVFSSQESRRFNLYVGGTQEVVLEGDADFYGNIYAYNGPDASGQYYGRVRITGSVRIYGSVIGYNVVRDKKEAGGIQGNAYIEFPSSGGTGSGGPGGTAPGEPVWFYGFDSLWEEVNPA